MKIKAIMTLIGFLASIALASAAPQTEKVKLSVLYAGGPDSPRAQEFKEFLGQHFTRVGVVQGQAFTPAMADGYDVVVFDPASGGGAPQLPPDFRRPSVLIAGGGVRIAMALKLKFDWYCRCLSKEAHGFDPTHAIFNTPLKAGIQYDEQPMPAYYKTVSPPNSLPTNLRTWQVARSDYTGDESVEPGMVSTPEGFEDSPDSEIISSGINTKGPNSVAIGRQGSFLMWGFETAPSNMTDSAKQVFVNSVAYISKFDGAPILVRKTSPSRDHAMMITNLFLNLKEYHAGLLKNAVEHNRMGAQFKKKQEAGQTLSDREKEFLSSFKAWEEPTYEQTVASTFRVVPPDVLAETGQNAQAVVDYYKKNKGYIVPGRGVLMGFDPDAKALGIANNDVRILDRSIELLAGGEDQERALRVLKRYTGLDFATAAEWKKWVDTNRSKLFFSDVGGFKFFINETKATSTAAMVEPTNDSPAVWNVGLDSSGPVKPGQTVALTISLRLAPGWHAYGDVPKGSPYAATVFEAKLPKGVSFVGEWNYPKLMPYDEGTSIIEGNAKFSRAIRIAAGAKGPVTIPVTISWQTCDLSRCLPPDRKIFSVEIPLV